MKYKGPSHKDLNVTVGVYLPRDLFDRLLQIAQEKTETKKSGWWSVSRLIREILADYVTETGK